MGTEPGLWIIKHDFEVLENKVQQVFGLKVLKTEEVKHNVGNFKMGVEVWKSLIFTRYYWEYQSKEEGRGRTRSTRQ
jgi:hypothetical protein